MGKYKHNNIIVGTGRLGRNEGREKDVERLKTIIFLLENGCGIHISPTYGNSFSKLENINISNLNPSKIITKIDFSRESKPNLQLELTRKLIKDKDLDVQITGDFRNILVNNYQLKNFEMDLNNYKNKYDIKSYYLSPLYHDTEYLINMTTKMNIKFDLALHFSLVEAEFKEKILNYKNFSTNIFALRAFGESIENYGNWYYPLGMELKSNAIKNNHIKSLNEILDKYNITKAQSRLIFALKNPLINYAALSFSSITQAKEALKINKSNIDKNLIEELIENNKKFPNKSRRGLGFRYPANNQYLQNHNPIKIIICSIRSNNIIFGLKNLLIILHLNTTRILKFILKKII